MKTLWPGCALAAWLFVLSYGVYGLHPTQFQDEYVFCHGVYRDMPAGDILVRNWQSIGITRYTAHFVERWLLPRLADCYWVVHLYMVALHAVNSGLIGLLVRGRTGSAWAGLAAAVLFALWPTKNEAVYWAAQFNIQTGTALMLTGLLLWLRAEPNRPGWWVRAWPTPLLLFLSAQFCEQSVTAGCAIPALTFAFPAAGGTWAGALGRFVAQGFYVAAGVGLYAAIFLSTVRSDTVNAGQKPRHEVAPPTAMSGKARTVLADQLRVLPGGKLDREYWRGAWRQVPELFREHPVLFPAAAVLTLAAVLAWAVWGGPASAPAADLPTPAPGLDVPLGAAVFAVLFWLFAHVPLVASGDNLWLPFRLAYIPSVGVWTAAAVIGWAAAARWGSALPGWTAIPVRLALAAALAAPWTLINAIDGRQYVRQFEADDAQARQIIGLLADRPDTTRLHVLVGEVTDNYSQPLGVRHCDHIVNGWTLPWAAASLLYKYEPVDDLENSLEYHVHPVGSYIKGVMGPETVVRRTGTLYAFRLPPWSGDAPAREMPMIPVDAVRLLDRKGRTRLIPLPRMRELIAARGLTAGEPITYGVRDLVEFDEWLATLPRPE